MSAFPLFKDHHQANQPVEYQRNYRNVCDKARTCH